MVAPKLSQACPHHVGGTSGGVWLAGCKYNGTSNSSKSTSVTNSPIMTAMEPFTFVMATPYQSSSNTMPKLSTQLPARQKPIIVYIPDSQIYAPCCTCSISIYTMQHTCSTCRMAWLRTYETELVWSCHTYAVCRYNKGLEGEVTPVEITDGITPVGVITCSIVL
jgi:hypothetical protein